MAKITPQQLLNTTALAHAELSEIYQTLAKYTFKYSSYKQPELFELLNEIAGIGEKYIELDKSNNTIPVTHSAYDAMMANRPPGIINPFGDGKEGEFTLYTAQDGHTFYVNPFDVVSSYERTFGKKLTDQEKADLQEAMLAGEAFLQAGASFAEASQIAAETAIKKSPGIADKAQ